MVKTINSMRVTTSIRIDVELFSKLKEKRINLTDLVNNLLAAYFVEEFGKDYSEEMEKQKLSAKIANEKMKIAQMESNLKKIQKKEEEEEEKNKKKFIEPMDPL